MTATEGPVPQPLGSGASPPPRTAAPEGRHRAPIGSVLLIVVGALLSLVAFGVAAAGGAFLWAHGTQRDAGGYYTTPTEQFETTSYAITSDAIDLGSAGREDPQSLGDLATVRIRAEGTESEPVFVGIARQRDVDAYLAGVGHARIDELSVAPFSVDYRYRDGGAPADPPTEEDFWAASASGSGPQSVRWSPSTGQWAVVVMNADGSAGVSVEASAGARVPWLLGVGIGLGIAGLLGLALGATMMVVGVVMLARPSTSTSAVPSRWPASRCASKPDSTSPLSRGLWLVKWLLLIPHFVVLAVLWVAFSVVTFIAFFAILFTGRYPRALFDFNVGVLRWTWRVGYYGYSALGTDRYPPFRLGHAADYPATLEVAYPARLSPRAGAGEVVAAGHPPLHGARVVLVGGGWAAGSRTRRRGLRRAPRHARVVRRGRAAVRRPLPAGMFDLVMGINRWVYRVITYVGLMTRRVPAVPPRPGRIRTAAPRCAGRTRRRRLCGHAPARRRHSGGQLSPFGGDPPAGLVPGDGGGVTGMV